MHLPFKHKGFEYDLCLIIFPHLISIELNMLNVNE